MTLNGEAYILHKTLLSTVSRQSIYIYPSKASYRTISSFKKSSSLNLSNLKFLFTIIAKRVMGSGVVEFSWS